MMATANSRPQTHAVALRGVVLGVFLLVTGVLLAGEAQKRIFAERAGTKFQQTEALLKSDPLNRTNLWQFTQACFDYAEFATNDIQRADLAQKGIATAKQLLKLEPDSVPGHYYLAMNLGQLARTQLLGALRLVHEMENEFKRAAELDAQFDYAGPERCLGMLYRDAPGWPTSLGSNRKARSCLEQAVKLSPNYPGNRLALLESYLKWNDRAEARTELAALNAIWAQAQTNFNGQAWEDEWDEWSARRDIANKKLGDSND